jgi:hypothetical protein
MCFSGVLSDEHLPHIVPPTTAQRFRVSRGSGSHWPPSASSPMLAGLQNELRRARHRDPPARDHANGEIEHSRSEMVLPKHGPTEGADSIPE